MEVTTGIPYNISLTGNRLLRGWHLLVTDSGEEFLVEKSFVLRTKRPLHLYQADRSFQDLMVRPRNTQHPLGNSVFVLIMVHILRRFIPLNLVFGTSNLPPKLSTGVLNVSVTCLAIMVWVLLGMAWRRFRLLYFGKRHGMVIKRVGTIRQLPEEVLKISGETTSQFGYKLRRAISYMILLGVVSLPILALSYVVELRLFLVLAGFLHWLIFFGGDEYLFSKRRRYDFKVTSI